MRSTILPIVLLPLILNAQTWCPPGAIWTYEAGLHLAGFNRLSYRADTVVDGYNAQVIDRYSAIQFPQSTEPTFGGAPFISYAPVVAITRHSDDVVYVRGPLGWDTLYWFGALPGEGWTVPHADPTGCEPFIVQDTGTTFVDGIPLRWLEFQDLRRVYERIGSTWDFHLFCPNMVIDGPSGMRCYQDEEIHFGVDASNCEALVNVASLEREKVLAPYPDPGSTYVTIDLGPDPHTITFYDAMGRRALQHHTTEMHPTVDTSALVSGRYVITVHDNSGNIQMAQWTKIP